MCRHIRLHSSELSNMINWCTNAFYAMCFATCMIHTFNHYFYNEIQEISIKKVSWILSCEFPVERTIWIRRTWPKITVVKDTKYWYWGCYNGLGGYSVTWAKMINTWHGKDMMLMWTLKSDQGNLKWLTLPFFVPMQHWSIPIKCNSCLISN